MQAVLLALVAGLVAPTFLPTKAGAATTYTVNSTADKAASQIVNPCVGGSECTLRAAVQLSNADSVADTIVLANNATYTLSRTGNDDTSVNGDLDITNPITIDANNSTISQAVTGQRVVHLLAAAGNVTLLEATLTGGNGVAGACIYATNSSSTLNSVTLTGCTAGSSNGGGLNVAAGSSLVATGGSISSNTAVAGGGAAVSGSLTLSHVDVVQNSAGSGGGIYANGSSLSVTGGTFSTNTASTGGGGAVWVQTGPASLADVSFLTNTAAANGGAINHNATTTNLQISGGLIDRNSAAGNGAGIYTKAASATLTNVNVTNNTVTGQASGGGLFVGAGTAVVSSSSFNNNHADALYGGGTYVASGATLTAPATTSNQWVHNSAAVGAGLYVTGSAGLDGAGSLGVMVIGNYASGSGGGIYVTSTGTLRAHNAFVQDNSAVSGGGIFSNGPATQIDKSVITWNFASGAGGGGGLRVGAGLTTMTESGLESNMAQGGTGGGAVVTGTGAVSSLVFHRGVVTQNESLGGGDGLATSGGGALTLRNVTITGNAGEGVRAEGSGVSTLRNVTVGSNDSTGIVQAGSASVTLLATIVDQPLSGAACSGTPVSAGKNIAADGTCALTGAGDQPNTQPELGALRTNSDYYPSTQLPSPNSPALDAAGVEPCAEPIDARGIARPHGAGCDVGAAEIDDAITIFGSDAPGYFRSMELPDVDPDNDGRVQTPSGQTAQMAKLSGWNMPPGLGPYFPTQSADGQIVMGVMTRTGSNDDATARSMKAISFDPKGPSRRLNVTGIQTRRPEGNDAVPAAQIRDKLVQHTGLSVYDPHYWPNDTGGADIGDVCAAGPTVFGVSGSTGKNTKVRQGDVAKITSAKSSLTGTNYRIQIQQYAGDNTWTDVGALSAAVPGGADSQTIDGILSTAIGVSGADDTVRVSIALNSVANGGGFDQTRVILVSFGGIYATADMRLDIRNVSAGWITPPTYSAYDGVDGSATSRFFGVYPSLVGLTTSGGGSGASAITVDESHTFTAEQLRQNGGTDQAYPLASDNAFREMASLHQTKAFAECEAIGTDRLAITQYGTTDGHRSGRIIVVGTDGTLHAFQQLPTDNLGDSDTKLDKCSSDRANYPCIPLPPSVSCPVGGCPIQLSPRDLNVGTVDGKTRISVIYDATFSSGDVVYAAPFPIQVLTYSEGAADPLTVDTPLMVAPLSGTTTVRYNQATFVQGQVVAAASDNEGGFAARRIDVFDLDADAVGLEGCAPPAGVSYTWVVAGTTCGKFDLAVHNSTFSSAPQLTGALNYDSERGLLLVTSGNAMLQVIRVENTGLSWVRGVDLGGGRLRCTTAPNPTCSGTAFDMWIRKGVVDLSSDMYYMPFFGFDKSIVPEQYNPDAADETKHYLFAIDLKQMN